MEQRRKPYIWPTWISGLLSGDKHCEWAAWLRAHYFYTKREEDGDRETSLKAWKAEHARFVSLHAETLEKAGWEVRFEDQNRFNYNGKAATVGGCPDVVAIKRSLGIARIDDAKTGKPRDSDAWQVAIYGALLPLCDTDLTDLVIVGNVIYKDRESEVTAQQMVEWKPIIIERVKKVASEHPPARRPSASECAFCDIAECPDRIESDILTADGDAF